jgi:hypothetical protein
VNDLTQARLRALLQYDPETGKFTRLIGVQGFAAGTEAGTFHPPSGYVYLGVDRKTYRAHRLAWFYMTGKWPVEDIDHANRDRADNRWANLREASRSQNNANGARRRDNTSGAKGVSWDAKNKRWRAYIVSSGKQRHLGRFADYEAAKAAYVRAATDTFGEFANA